MDFKNYQVIPNFNSGKKNLFTATIGEIILCEKVMGIQFDADYKEYVLTYGNGILGGTYIRVYLPLRIEKTLNEWRKRITKYWFWDEGKDVLTKDQALVAVRIGDTFDGDEIIFFKNEYYILPRNSEMIYKTGKTLDETVKWLCGSGILTEPFEERQFEPFDPSEWEE